MTLGILALLVRFVMLQGTSTQKKIIDLPSIIGSMGVYLPLIFVLKDAFMPFISPFSHSIIAR